MRAARLRLQKVLRGETADNGQRMANAPEEIHAHGKAPTPKIRKANEAGALADKRVQEKEKEREKKNPKNEEKARGKGKEKEMTKSLIELLLPSLPKSRANRLWANRMSHLATTILQANAKKAQIAIGGILLSADFTSR